MDSRIYGYDDIGRYHYIMNPNRLESVVKCYGELERVDENQNAVYLACKECGKLVVDSKVD
jgi:capsule polysaccharide export protein KpsC/LpsZ